MDLAVTAEQGSTLLINTSSSTKVYRARSCGTAAQQRMHATVGEGALLVVAPDPVVPFQQSRYVQENVFDVEDGGSLVAVDFVNSGRSACGERWALDLYRSHSEYRRVRGGSSARDPTTSATPTPMMLCKTVLVDATELDQSTRGRANWGMDIGDFACNSFASVVLIGPRTEGVARNMLAVAAEVASRCGARVAGPQSLALKSAFGTGSARAAATGMSGADEPDCATLAAGLTLSSTLYMGISHVAVGSAGEETGATVVRIAAQVPQDIIRVLKMSLAPLEHSLGAVPYADRVHAVSSEPACAPGQATFAYKHGDPLLQSPIPRDQHSADSSSGHRGGSSTAQRSSTGRGSTASNYWALMQLADATLPTGGFAHSGGLEAAAQLGLFSPSHTSSGGGGGGQVHEEAALMDWVESAMVAHAKLQSPFAAQAHALTHGECPSPSSQLLQLAGYVFN